MTEKAVPFIKDMVNSVTIEILKTESCRENSTAQFGPMETVWKTPGFQKRYGCKQMGSKNN